MSQVPSAANKGPSNLPGRHNGVGAGVGLGVGEGVGLGVGFGIQALAPVFPPVQSVSEQASHASESGTGENCPLGQSAHTRSDMSVNASD